MVNGEQKTWRPASLAEALELRNKTRSLPFAGGTDLMVRYRGYTGTGSRILGHVLFLDALDELKTIKAGKNNLVIGGALPLGRILEFPDLPALLEQSLSLIAAPGLRNLATLGGNICNASPAADSLPPLLVHQAVFRLQSVSGVREVPAGQFFTGPGKTVLAEDELLTHVIIPRLPGDHRPNGQTGESLFYYRKIGTRKANALSKLSAAGYARFQGDRISDFRFSLGAVAPTVIRLNGAEGLVVSGSGRNAILAEAGKMIRPIDDQRSTAAYRKQAALNCIEEFLDEISETIRSDKGEHYGV